jgi:hypothetical protein
LAAQIHLTQIELSFYMPLFGSFLIPPECLGVVFRYAFTPEIHSRQLELSVCASLLGKPAALIGGGGQLSPLNHFLSM